MAAFIYPMENVLRIKERIEEQKRMELGQAMVAWQDAVKVKEAMEARLKADLETFYGDQRGFVSATRLGQMSAQVAFVAAEVKAQEGLVAGALGVVEQKREALKKALEEKKIQEKLKEKAYERWYEEERLKEQQTLDEIVGYRYAVKEEEHE